MEILNNVFESNYCRWHCNDKMFLGLGIIIFPMMFSGTYQMIRCMITFRARKTNKKCKHLQNFPTAVIELSNRIWNKQRTTENNSNTITEYQSTTITAPADHFILCYLLFYHWLL
jgi:hypothetical protein